MTDDQRDDFAQRLAAARSASDSDSDSGRARAREPQAPQGQGLALAGRVVAELVATLGVAIALGLFLDRHFDTAPWLMLLFVLLGFGAALLNLIRLSRSLERKRKGETPKGEL